MYTKIDLIENKKMGEILKENKIKTRNLLIKKAKIKKKNQIISGFIVCIGFALIMYIIAIIESLNF